MLNSSNNSQLQIFSYFYINCLFSKLDNEFPLGVLLKRGLLKSNLAPALPSKVLGSSVNDSQNGKKSLST